mgnify:CR=1 FL=1
MATATQTSGRDLGAELGLTGLTCLVTGATRGIGEAVALGLARLGMNIVALGRDTERLDALARRAAQEGLALLPTPADITSEPQVTAAVEAGAAKFGRVDAAFVNAGVAVVEPALEVSAEDFARVVDVNLTGSFITARAVARAICAGGPSAGGGAKGAIVFTSSTFADTAEPAWSSYCASKAGVSMLARVLAVEWAKIGIRVNAVAPTATLTEQNRDLFADDAFRAAVTSRIPVGRLLEREELILPVAFLLSPRNPMLTGQTLFVDGGWTL